MAKILERNLTLLNARKDYSLTGPGRLENRIFGKGIFTEDGAGQITPRRVLARGIGPLELRHQIRRQ